jgi:hypothetical protein
MFGVAWFVQLVHYPIFMFLNYDSSKNPFIFHQSRTAIAVMIPMILELVSIMLLVFVPYPNFFAVLVLLILTLLIWLCTFTMQVPAHKILKREKNEDVIKKLIRTNWLRTGLWTLKAIYLFFIIWNVLSDSIVVIC